MKIQEITVHASRTLPHPIESYANIKPEVTLRATLDDGDDPAEAVRQLQATAENLVENHAAVLKAAIEDRELYNREQAELERLRLSVSRNQVQLAEAEQRLAQRIQPNQQQLFGDTSAAIAENQDG